MSKTAWILLKCLQYANKLFQQYAQHQLTKLTVIFEPHCQPSVKLFKQISFEPAGRQFTREHEFQFSKTVELFSGLQFSISQNRGFFHVPGFRIQTRPRAPASVFRLGFSRGGSLPPENGRGKRCRRFSLPEFLPLSSPREILSSPLPLYDGENGEKIFFDATNRKMPRQRLLTGG